MPHCCASNVLQNNEGSMAVRYADNNIMIRHWCDVMICWLIVGAIRINLTYI